MQANCIRCWEGLSRCEGLTPAIGANLALSLLIVSETLFQPVLD